MTASDVLRSYYGVDEETAKEIIAEMHDTKALERLTESRANIAPKATRLVSGIATFDK